MIQASLTAVPPRARLLSAKAIVPCILAVGVALPVVAACLIVGRLLLPGTGPGPAHGAALVSLAAWPTLRAALGTVLALGLGVGTIVRDTAAAAGGVLGLLYLPPLSALLVPDPWHTRIEQVAPRTAGLSVEATRHLGSLADRPWTGMRFSPPGRRDCCCSAGRS